MSSHDDDIIDFDFFEDDATREQTGGRGDNPGRLVAEGGGGGRRRQRFRAPQGVTPLLRLIGLVAFAILVVVLLVLWAQGCSSDRKRNDYSNAMADLGHDRLELGEDRHEPCRAPHDAGAEAGRARDVPRRA